MRELEAENAKLKRIYADLTLENTAIKDLLKRTMDARDSFMMWQACTVAVVPSNYQPYLPI